MAVNLGDEARVYIGVGANRAVRAQATLISPDWNLSTHTFNNPRPSAADAGPNTGEFRRVDRMEDASYNVTPFITEGNLALFAALRSGAACNLWINEFGAEAGEPYTEFEGVARCSITLDGGFKRWNLQVDLNDTTSVDVN